MHRNKWLSSANLSRKSSCSCVTSIYSWSWAEVTAGKLRWSFPQNTCIFWRVLSSRSVLTSKLVVSNISISQKALFHRTFKSTPFPGKAVRLFRFTWLLLNDRLLWLLISITLRPLVRLTCHSFQAESRF